MGDSIQLVHVVMWEPSDTSSAAPFEFSWSHSRSEMDAWRAELLECEAVGLTVYSGTLPLPTDGDFADEKRLEHSLRQILGDWPRNQLPPPEQALDGQVVFVGVGPSRPGSPQ